VYQFVCERNAMQDAGKGTTYTRQNTLDWIGRAYSAPSGTQLVRTGITAPPHEPSHPPLRASICGPAGLACPLQYHFYL